MRPVRFISTVSPAQQTVIRCWQTLKMMKSTTLPQMPLTQSWKKHVQTRRQTHLSAKQCIYRKAVTTQNKPGKSDVCGLHTSAFRAFVLFCGTSEAAVSYCICIVIHGDSVFHKDPLHKTGSCRDLDRFIFSCIVSQLGKDMTFVVGKEIIAVNDSHCVIQLQPEFKSQSASRIHGFRSVSLRSHLASWSHPQVHKNHILHFRS